MASPVNRSFRLPLRFAPPPYGAVSPSSRLSQASGPGGGALPVAPLLLRVAPTAPPTDSDSLELELTPRWFASWVTPSPRLQVRPLAPRILVGPPPGAGIAQKLLLAQEVFLVQEVLLIGGVLVRILSCAGENNYGHDEPY